MDGFNQEKTINANYVSQILRQQTLPPDIARYLAEQEVTKHGSKAAGLQQSMCPRCYTPDEFLATISPSSCCPSLLPHCRSQHRLLSKSRRHKLSAREQQMLASHENFENIFLIRCPVCHHLRRIACTLPHYDKLKKRKVMTAARKAQLQQDSKCQLPKIVVPEIMMPKPTRKPKSDEVDCGLNISPALKLQLAHFTEKNPVKPVSDNTPTSKKRKKKKNKKSVQNNAAETQSSQKIGVSLPVVANESGYLGTSPALSSSKAGQQQSSSHKLTLTTPKVNLKSKKPMSASTTNALKQALKKSVPKQSSLKNFLDTLF